MLILPLELGPTRRAACEHGPVPFALYEYDDAFSRFIRETLQALAVARSPLLGQIESFETSGTVASRIRDRSGLDLALEPQKTSTEFSSDFKAVRAGDYVELQAELDRGSDSMAEQMEGLVVDGMRQITESTGNVVHAGGRPLSFDVMYETLEKMEFSLDDDDELVMPSILLHPDQMKRIAQLPEPTPEQTAKLEALKEKKKAEALARRRSRRLS